MRPFRRARRYLPVLLPLLLLVGTGIRGLEFGQHWDERHYQIDPMETMIATGWPLPGYYGYPSFDYWISAASTLPDVLVELVRGPGARERVLQRIETHRFLLRVRLVFLCVSALAVLWVYRLVLESRDSVPEALVAASLLATSWEVAYHSRWIATDGVLMQFGALTIFLVMRAQLRPPAAARWLFLAAGAAGLGAGTKYPGALLLAPVLVGGWFAWRGRVRGKVVLGRLLALVAVAFAAFALTNPAVVLAPRAMLAGMIAEMHHYAGGHYGHTVRPGLGHLFRILTYLGTVQLSGYGPIAVFLASLSVLGAWTLRREPRTLILLLSFPVVYVSYFALQSALLVRNFLVVAPFLVILAARGAASCWARPRTAGGDAARAPVRSRATRAAFVMALGLAISIDAGWLWHASTTIRARKTDRFAREALAYVRARSATTFYVSPRVRTHFAVLGAGPLPNVVSDPAQAGHVMFYAHEGVRRFQEWRATRFRLTERWFGPYEVNFNVYPNWWGDDRIVLMTAAKAKALGLPIVAQPGR